MESKISAITLDHKYIHCEFRSFFFTFTLCHFRLCQFFLFFPSVIVNLAAITCASSPLASRDHHAKSKFRNSSEIIKFAGVHGPNYVWLWRPHETSYVFRRELRSNPQKRTDLNDDLCDIVACCEVPSTEKALKPDFGRPKLGQVGWIIYSTLQFIFRGTKPTRTCFP